MVLCLKVSFVFSIINRIEFVQQIMYIPFYIYDSRCQDLVFQISNCFIQYHCSNTMLLSIIMKYVGIDLFTRLSVTLNCFLHLSLFFIVLSSHVFLVEVSVKCFILNLFIVCINFPITYHFSVSHDDSSVTLCCQLRNINDIIDMLLIVHTSLVTLNTIAYSLLGLTLLSGYKTISFIGTCSLYSLDTIPVAPIIISTT